MIYFLVIDEKTLLVVLPDSCLLLLMLWHPHISFDHELDYFCDILLGFVTLSMEGAFYLRGCKFFHSVYDISLLTYFSPLFHQNPLSSVMTLSWKQKEYHFLIYWNYSFFHYFKINIIKLSLCVIIAHFFPNSKDNENSDLILQKFHYIFNKS